VKLLIAEDDPFFRRILQQLLGSEFEVSIAVDGNQDGRCSKQRTGRDWPSSTG